PPASAEAGLQAAKLRWPMEPLVLYASAVQAGNGGRWQDAARDYTALLEIDPANAAARNNLANMLAEGGCLADALDEARAALAAVRADSPLRPAIQDTVDTLIAGATSAVDEPAHCRTVY